MNLSEREFAKEYALHTNEILFLTGRAGTGKTTLLKEILSETSKKTAVVAPTGVAAINAGGMTIHSFFQLPPTGFIPTDDDCDPEQFTNRKSLARTQKLRRERIQLLIELEFLIIDEISMVRADLFDAIDVTLRRIRKNAEIFGGVQVMVIGDLFQLSPVVRRDSFRTLTKYYKSPYFFDSLAWQQAKSITIELKEIYRQEDDVFINILNNIRIGIQADDDIKKLNTRLVNKPDLKNVITLTTHNAQAKKINESKLKALDHPKYNLDATVSGRFSPSSYPVNEQIILKKGSQVMFIRNHSDGIYFNGKIGIVEKINEDSIHVLCDGDSTDIIVEPTEWKNIAYTVDKETKEIYKEEIGSFTQYPLKLAWAVTVHKSQGLTFEELILDVSNTFAPGQLYVALSRAKSLHGLYLISPISKENIIIDERISDYYNKEITPPDIRQLSKSKAEYDDIKIRKHWRFNALISHLEYWKELAEDTIESENEDPFSLIDVLHKKLNKLEITGKRFAEQLSVLTKEYKSDDKELDMIIERCRSAILYFGKEIHDHFIVPVDKHYRDWKFKSGIKKYVHFLEMFINDLWHKLEQLFTIKYRSITIHQEAIPYKRIRYFNPDRPKKKKKKGATYQETLSLILEEKTIDEIAKIRSLAYSTIESHINRLLKEEKINLDMVMPHERQESLLSRYPKDPDLTLTDVKAKIPEASYGELRWIKTHLELQEKAKK